MTKHRPPSSAIRCLLLFVLLLFPCVFAQAQSATATLSGTVVDQNNAVVPGAMITVTNTATGLKRETTTNDEGYFTIPLLPPSSYVVRAEHSGFSPIQIPSVVLNVGDQKALQIQLKAGDINATVQVVNDAPLLDTESAAVSTVVDRQFAENLPMNGRSFQTLIQLTPGVVLTANNGRDTGQFSVNGQRATSNYWMVDGVGANIGVSVVSTPGQGLGGALGSASAFGGTNSLVSVDALQEFRIQTSTYAPEFGRTPGAQISIVTRSGTNQFHATVFDYLRNDVFDANDWFANSTKQPKPKERQNDFGGTFGGPILKDKTFFFFSYEGLRLRLPQTLLTNVPDTNPLDPFSRQFAAPSIQPLLNAYPLPNGPEILTSTGNHQGIAQFNASFSNPGTLDAYSFRVDHKVNNKLSLFGRYNYSPSELDQRASASALSVVTPTRITTHTATAGLTWSISPMAANDFRFNYSKTDASNSSFLDTFGGAVPLSSLPFPNSALTTQNSAFNYAIFSLGSPAFFITDGINLAVKQHQINIVDSVSVTKASHSMKFGVDYRRLTPEFAPRAYNLVAVMFTVPSANTGNVPLYTLQSNSKATFLFREFGAFAQDTWRVAPRLTMTYGLRWDVDFVPSAIKGPNFAAVTGFNLSDLSNLALAPAGTPPYQTTYGNFAPRIGLAFQLSQRKDWQTVFRGGFGVFYDLSSSEAGNAASLTFYPFGIGTSVSGGPYPPTAAQVAPPQIVAPNASNGNTLHGFNPNLKLPYTLEWNVTMEQSLGKQQTVTVSYIGAAGKRLLQTASVTAPNTNLGAAQLVTNAAVSNYKALQVQFQRQLSHGLQALASYTWSHSIDTASAGSFGNAANNFGLNSSTNQGPSDFDIRNAFSAALTYDLPSPKSNVFAKAILGGWSTENIFQARSAPPVNVFYGFFSVLSSSNFTAQVRPNVISGAPLYLYGPNYPGGKAFNPAAFTGPPLGANNLPTAQGNLGRNTLRGFGAYQWDFAVHRDFPIRESVKLQLRAEIFNLLNHPNFGQPVGNLGTPAIGNNPAALNSQFGLSQQMLGRSLAGQTGLGGFNPLYNIGGPRSMQFALKLFF